MRYQPYDFYFPRADDILLQSQSSSNDPLDLTDMINFPDANFFQEDEIYPVNNLDDDYLFQTFQRTNSLFSRLIYDNFDVRNIFITKKNKQKGRHVSENLLGKKHGKYDFDNILTKIQVHFISFLVDMVNDAVNEEFDKEFLDALVKKDNKISKRDFFKDINYEDKRKIKHSYIMDCFEKPIKDIIQKNISMKFKNLNPDYNKKLYEKLAEKSEWFSDLLNMKYIDVFYEYYYNQEKKLEKIVFEEKTINISEYTKSFYYLLKKQENLSQEIIDVVNDVYLNKVNNDNNETNNEKKFIVNKAKK